MKNILLLLTAMLFTCTSAFAVPVMIQNMSNLNNNPNLPGGYDAHIYLGVRAPSQNCLDDRVFSFTLTPNQTVVYDGQTAMAGTCLQDYFWGISCSDPTFDQYFPGMRFWIQQGTFPGAQPVPSTEYIAGFTRELHCQPDHSNLQLINGGPNWFIKNNPSATVNLTFIDLGFMHQYVFN